MSTNILPEEMELKKQIVNLNHLLREEISGDKRDALFLKRDELLTKLDVLLEKYRMQ